MELRKVNVMVNQFELLTKSAVHSATRPISKHDQYPLHSHESHEHNDISQPA